MGGAEVKGAEVLACSTPSAEVRSAEVSHISDLPGWKSRLSGGLRSEGLIAGKERGNSEPLSFTGKRSYSLRFAVEAARTV